MTDQPDRVIKRKELQKMIGVTSQTITRMMKDRLPKPDLQLSRKTVGWKVSTLVAAGINVE